MNVRQGKYICEVVLPPSSPVKSAIGRLSPRKLIARQSAAFNACIMLIKEEHLDEHFLPKYVKQLPALRNARLAIENKKQDAYEMLTKPSLWAEGRGDLPGTYYMTTISLDDQWDRPTRPLALITRMRLPSLPQFPLYRLDGGQVNVLCSSVNCGLTLSTSEVGELTGFTLTIFKDIYNKTFENVPEKMSYWLAPMNSDALDHGEMTIDWDVVHDTSHQEAYQWKTTMDAHQLAGKFLIDPFDGGRRIFVTGITKDLKPTDPAPQDVPGKYKKDSIISYSVALWTKSKRNAVWDTEQPVIEGHQIMHRLNALATPNEQEQTARTRCFVIAEPFRVSLVSPSYHSRDVLLNTTAAIGCRKHGSSVPGNHSSHRILPDRFGLLC